MRKPLGWSGQLRTVLLGLGCLLTAGETRAIDLSVMPGWIPTRLDSVRTSLLEARVTAPDAEFRSCLQDALGQYPGDGFVLREAVLRVRSGPGMEAAVRGPDLKGQPFLPTGSAFTPADLEFLAGLACYYRDHAASADRHFGRALDLRPGWSWARFYRARNRLDLLAPRAELDAEFQSLLQDPQIAPAVLDFLANDLMAGEARRQTAARLSETCQVPWERGWVADLGMQRSIRERNFTAALAESLWLVAAAYAPAVRAACVCSLIEAIPERLAPEDAEAFLLPRLLEIERGDRPHESGDEVAALRSGLASVRLSLGFARQADSLLASVPWPESVIGRLARARARVSRDEVRRGAERLLATYAGRWSLDEARGGFLDLDEREMAKACLDTLRLECPVEWAMRRLWGLLDTDPGLAEGLADSLIREGYEPPAVPAVRLIAGEALGDTLPIPEVRERVARYPSFLENLARVARARGDHSRLSRLLRLWMELRPQTPGVLLTSLQLAGEAQDSSVVREAVSRLRQVCPDAPTAFAARVAAFVGLGRHDDARRELLRWAALPNLPVESAIDAAGWAASLRETEVEERMMARAESLDPKSRQVAYARACSLLGKQELQRARPIADELVREFPGRSAYRDLSRRVGGSEPTPEALPAGDADLASAFEGFGHDLASIDWILRARAPSDSFPGADALVLREQQSWVVSRIDWTFTRFRTTIQILNESALGRYQPFSIFFIPSSGTPQIRVARVIRPDGSVVEVPRGDIFVAAREEGPGQIGDSRRLVVPLPALGVGGVLDLVWDTAGQSQFRSGWSNWFVFGDFLPQRESILELRLARNLPVAIHAEPGLESPAPRLDGPWEYRTWRRSGHAPAFNETDTPGLMRQCPWVAVSTYPSWREIAAQYREDFWKPIENPEEIRREATGMIHGVHGTRERVAAIQAAVVRRVKYLGVEMGRGRIVPSQPGEVLRRGYGDCKDMSRLSIALLDAVGIEAEPVLLSTAADLQPRPDLPQSEIFNHLVVRVPEVDGGLFFDPARGDSCILGLLADQGGLIGLRVPRQGDGELVQVPKARPQDHEVELLVDFRPESDRIARITIEAKYRGQYIKHVRNWLSNPDAAQVSSFLDDHLAPSHWNSLVRRSWRIEREDCTELCLSAVYEDTAWAGDQHSVGFRFATEMAAPSLSLPDPEGRKQDVRLPLPFRSRATLRFHDGAGWSFRSKIAEVTVDGPAGGGNLTAEDRSSGEDHWCEIRQSFEMNRIEFTPQEYAAFHRDWLRFQIAVYQDLSYRRVLETDELQRIVEYCAAHPEDFAFATQAALRILGNDTGGDGAEGEERRRVVRRILAAALESPEAGTLPLILVATTESTEGRVGRADSLAQLAVARSPNDRDALSYQCATQRDLGHIDQEIVTLQKMQRLGASGKDLRLVTAFLITGREDEARREEQRFFTLHSRPADTTAVWEARYRAFTAAGRWAEAEAVLESLRPRVDPADFEVERGSLLQSSGRHAEALPIWEKMWRQDPLNPAVCNNLAWSDAMLGRDLDRAEELVRSAITLTSDPSNKQNTLGTIYARRRDWEKARELFLQARNMNDRPETRIVNDYFVGLCDWELGRKDQAVALWQSTLAFGQSVFSEPEWVARVRLSIERSERGDPVIDVIFPEP